MIEASRASISVFLSVIFLSLVILSCSIVDLSRIHIAKVQSSRGLDLGTGSILASFDSELALEYGIYGYDHVDAEKTNRDLEYYFRESLSPDNRWNDYDISNTAVISADPILQTQYLNEQIMAYMKYRGPYLTIEAFLKNLDVFSKSTKTTEIIALNNQVASSVEAANYDYIQLENLVDGILLDADNMVSITDGIPDVFPYYVKKLVPETISTNTFNIPDALLEDTINDSLVNVTATIDGLKDAIVLGHSDLNTFQSSMNEYIDLLVVLESLNLSVAQSQSTLQTLKNKEGNEAAIEACENTIASLQLQQFHCNESIAIQTQIMTVSGQSFNTHFNQLNQYKIDIITPLVDGYDPHAYEFGLIGIHEAALACISNIEITNAALKEQVNTLEDTLIQGGDIYIEEVYDKITEDLESYKDYLGDNEAGGSSEVALAHMKSVLESNLVLLRTIEPIAIDVMNTINTIPKSWLNLSAYYSDSYSQQISCIKTYTNIEIIDINTSVETPYSEQELLNNIEDIENKLATYQTDIVFDYNEISEANEHISAGDITTLLETELSLDIPDFDSVIEENHLPSDYQGAMDQPLEVPSKLDLTASIQIFNWLAQIGEFFGNQAEDLLGNVYLNEYIMGMFNHGTTDGEDESGKRIGMNHMDLGEHKYDYEIEYILFGNEALYQNVIAVVGIIFAMRVLLNTVHLISSPSKMSTITDMANIIAGWWSLGIGALPVAILLTFIWSCIESTIDICDLLKGDKVPLLKNEANWSSDLDNLLAIGIEDSEEVETLEEIGSFGYEDYLRLILYLSITSEEDKLMRIMDLIQINIGDQQSKDVLLENYVYDVSTSGEIEVNWLFFELPFMPETIRGLVGNSSFEVTAYQCYQ